MSNRRYILAAIAFLSVACSPAAAQEPANRWTLLREDPVGARRGSALRYAPPTDAFLLWGFMNANPDLLQEHPLIEVPEYDMVAFDLQTRRWKNQLPRAWERMWSRKLPLAYSPRTYSGITSGSERSLMRSSSDEPEAAPRPDLNIVFDQVAYHPRSHALFYFTGGLTALYDVVERRWRDLAPEHSPPPVLGGSLAYDPVHDEMLLFGGGHVAEPGPDGGIVGYTGAWAYSFDERDWRRLSDSPLPAPRMNTRMVLDERRNALVLFGGDAQDRYLADLWIYDLGARRWRRSRAEGGPEARAGHFTVYDKKTGWIILGGGYNRRDLDDMWAYDADRDRWMRLKGRVPAGFYISADIDPARRSIVLTANRRAPGDTMSCNVLFPVRATYGYRIAERTILDSAPSAPVRKAILKQPPREQSGESGEDRARRDAQRRRLESLPVNRWAALADPAGSAPVRTWGSATFDSDGGRIFYWGGGHCGYGGSDVSLYDIDRHAWPAGDPAPEFPGRSWNLGVRLAGVTFQGGPWATHGRKTYAYDPVSRKMIMARTIRLTAGYDPAPLAGFPALHGVHADALVSPPSSCVKFATWAFDPETSRWETPVPAPAGLDTLVSTPRGVIGLTLNWRARLNDAGYLLPASAASGSGETRVYLYDALAKRWERLDRGGGASPGNLYEMTSLAYDSTRGQLVLHGAGAHRNELWTFDLSGRRWQNMRPRVAAPPSGAPPVTARESVWIPGQDVLLLYGWRAAGEHTPALWEWAPVENEWRRLSIAPPATDPATAGSQNRALVYDQRRDVALLVLGERGDEGRTRLFALRYRRAE